MRLFVFFGGLIVIALVTALLAPLFINWTDYKDRFEAEASRILGQPVRVAGNASARLLPFPSVTFTDVEVGPPEAPVLRTERFAMDVELAPFMTGEVLIFDLRIERPQVTITLDETGAPVWPAPSERLINPAQISLENAAINGANITIIDPAEERTIVARDVNMIISANSFFGPWRAAGEAVIGETDVEFTASTGQFSLEGFSVQLGLTVPDYLVRIQSDGRVAPDEASDELRYAGDFRLRPHLVDQAYVVEGYFSSTARTLNIDGFRASFGDPGDPYLVQGDAAFWGGEMPGYRIEARGNQINVETEDTGQNQQTADAIPLRDRLTAIQDFVIGMPIPPIAGTISLDLPAIIAGDTTIRDVRLNARPEDLGGVTRNWQFDRIEAQFPGRTLLEADGVLRLPEPGRGVEETVFAGQMIVASRQPTGLARWLGVEVSESVRQLSGAGFSADVTISATRQAAENVEIIAGDARLMGRVARRSAGEGARPYVSVILEGAGLEGTSLQALSAITGAGEGGALTESHDVDLALDLSDVIIADTAVERLDTVVRARGDRAEIDRFVASGVHEATITGTGSLSRLADGGLSAGFDLGVVAANAAPLARALAERVPNNAVLTHLGRAAALRSSIADDTQLAMIGAARLSPGGAVETIAADLSGLVDGAAVSGSLAGPGVIRDGSLPFELNLSLSETNPLALMAMGGVPLLSNDSEAFGLSLPAWLDLGLEREGPGAPVTMQLSAITLEDRVSFDGTIEEAGAQPVFAGELDVSAADAEPYLTAMGLIVPGMGFGTPVRLSADVSRSAETWRFVDLSAEIADTGVSGEWTYTDDALLGRSVRGTMDATGFDASLLAAFYTGQLDWPGTETAFLPPLYDGMQVEVDLTTDQLWLGPLAFSDASTTLDINRNLLTVSDFRATAHAGTIVAGDIRLQNDGGLINAAGQIKLDDLPANAVLGEAQPGLNGALDVTLSLTGSGANGASLMRSLTGTGLVQAQDLTVAGFNAAAMDQIIPAADAIGFEITPAQITGIAEQALFSGDTVFEDVDVPVSVNDGTVQAANLALSPSQGATRLAGAMRYDLVGRQIESAFNVRLDPGEASVAGMSADVGLDLALTAGQPLIVDMDWTGLTAFITQRALEIEQARIERLQSRLLERQRLRREVRYAQYLRTERLVREEEARQRELGRERLEQLRLEQLRLIVPETRLEPVAPVVPAPESPPVDAVAPILDPDQVVRRPLAPIGVGGRADTASENIAPVPAPQIDFSPDTIETIIQSAPGPGFQ